MLNYKFFNGEEEEILWCSERGWMTEERVFQVFREAGHVRNALRMTTV
jgi:hypothetical protein